MISVFTPTNDSTFLPQIYASLCAQTDPDWQWTIAYNNGGVPVGFRDPRVAEHVIYKAPEFVGAAKAITCDLAPGDVLLELDHDDLLLPQAIERVKAAFVDESVGFVYSNTVYTDAQGGRPQRYSEQFGWSYRELSHEGRTLDEYVSFPPSPEAVSRIWYAPNHVRAFRRSSYEAVGGYNRGMRVLDDQDLMCRLYAHTKFHHIDEGLYLYRVHGNNTWLKHNAEIQANVYPLHDRYAESMALASARRRGLRCVDLGAAFGKPDGYEGIDLAGADISADLEGTWPFADSSVGVVRAYDVLEHLRDPLHAMRECYRVLAPGGWLLAQVPSTDGRGAFQDPTHRSFWNENSWLYYTHANWAKYISTPVRFQAVRLYTTEKDARSVCWTIAHLVSLKGGYRPPGLIEI